jgi:plasmid stability protein
METQDIGGMLELDLIRSLIDRASRNGRSLREEIRGILAQENPVDYDRILQGLSQRRGRVKDWNFFEEISRR